MRIGIAEDHTHILNYLTYVLEAAHHTVYPHISGASLIERLFVDQPEHASIPYDLLLLDLWLPGGPSGTEILEYVRQAFPAHVLPIVIISSASGNQLNRLSQKYAYVQVLRKPFSLKNLLHSIDASQPPPSLLRDA